MSVWLRFGISIATIAVFGWLDYLTGPDIGFSLFYLLPVTAVAWRLGRTSSALAGLAAAVSWYVAQYHLTGANTPVLLWNSFTRLVLYVGIALLVQEVVEDRRRLRVALEHETELANTDWMTGLANSRWFDQRLREAIARATRERTALCLAYFDLDEFKRLNDAMGHHAGDDVLREVGATLRATIREGDLAARLGGDEFAILFAGISRAAAEEIARRIGERIRALGERYESAALDASIGLAYFPTPPDDPDRMIRIADDAMYRAKGAGKGRVVWAEGNFSDAAALV